MLSVTHFFFAITVAFVLKFPVLPAGAVSLLVDMDYFLDYDFPFMHRGIVHTPIFLAMSIVILYLVTRRWDFTLSIGAGVLTHLFLDMINPMGILLLFPQVNFYSLNLIHYNNIIANVVMVLWSIAFILLLKSRWFQKKMHDGFNLNMGFGGRL